MSRRGKLCHAFSMETSRSQALQRRTHSEDRAVTRVNSLARVALLVLGGLALLQSYPVPASAQESQVLPSPLRIEQVLQLAREHRPEIAGARARAQAFAQRPAIVSALDDPMVAPSVDHLPFMLDGADVSFTVEQRFPLSRVRSNRRRAAEAESLGAKAEVDRVELDVELDATQAFLMLQERRGMASVLEEQRALAQQFLRAATARYAAGTGGQSDALRAEIEVSRLDGALRSIAAEVRAAEVMLNSSLGRSAEAPVPVLDSSISTATPPEAATVRAAALGARPELRAGNAEINRAQAEISVMQSMYAPMAVIRTGPAYTMDEGSGWMMMVGISIPIWRGKLRAGVAEAESMARMAEADLQSMRRMIEGEALATREQVIGSRERFLSLRDEIIPRARQAIDPTLAGYASGQLPLVSVIDAAQVLRTSEGELTSAQFELGLSWARLRRAMGDTGVLQ
jgi:outer membrane protein, heavy metal efflux system